MLPRVRHIVGLERSTYPPRDVKLLRLWERLTAIKSNKKKLEVDEYKKVQKWWAEERDKLKSEEARELMHKKLFNIIKNAVARYVLEDNF